MVRRIGFGFERPEQPRDLDHSTGATEAGTGDDADGGVVRWLIVLFLLAWLAVWTAGLYFAVVNFPDAAEESLGMAAFLSVWILFAAAGWIFVVRMVIRLLRGQPLPKAEPD